MPHDLFDGDLQASGEVRQWGEGDLESEAFEALDVGAGLPGDVAAVVVDAEVLVMRAGVGSSVW